MGIITPGNVKGYFGRMVKVKAHKNGKGMYWFSGEITGTLMDYYPDTKEVVIKEANRKMVVLLPDESIELI